MIGKLSLEQELELKILTDQAQGLSLEQARKYIVEVMRQMMIRDNLLSHLLTENGLPQEQYTKAIIFQGKSSWHEGT